MTDPKATQKRELRPFQKSGVKFLYDNNWRVLIADAPGCGKTPTALVAVRENIPHLCPALVIVPSSVVVNWKREMEAWIPGCRIQTINSIRTPINKNFHFTIVCWDLIARRKHDIKARKYKLVIADEAHYAKGGEQTLRGRAFGDIVKSVPHLLLLTGTPLVNDATELETLKSFFGENAKVPILRRLLEEVAPDIPQKKRVKLLVDLPEEIKSEYDRVKATFGDWVDDYLRKAMDDPTAAISAAEKAMSAEPLAKLSYLRRVLGRGKAVGAAAWIKGMLRQGEPVVVFGMFRDVMDILGQLLARLEIPFVRYDGSMGRQQRQIAVDAFCHGEVDVFLCTMAGREGLTLHRGDIMARNPEIKLKQPAHLLFMERWYTPAAEEQAEDRIRRIGQKRATKMWYLHAPGTIDDRIDELVEAKRQIVHDTIRSFSVDTSEYDGILDHWRNNPILSAGVPGVAENPDASLDLPKLPDPKFIHAVVFDPRIWPIPSVQKFLRLSGYRQRKFVRKGNTVKIVCRSITNFRVDTMLATLVKDGFGLHYGKPNAGTAQERMATLRRMRRMGRA
jgi:SNF2 family DNA or RNA helicase